VQKALQGQFIVKAVQSVEGKRGGEMSIFDEQDIIDMTSDLAKNVARAEGGKTCGECEFYRSKFDGCSERIYNIETAYACPDFKVREGER
jgi:hypothetical protein